MTPLPTAAQIVEWRSVAEEYGHSTSCPLRPALRQAADACAALLKRVAELERSISAGSRRTLLERAEKAEARVKELEEALAEK